MKIAFWGNTRHCGVTSNLAAISVASVIRFPYRLITFENHLGPNNLGSIYLGKPRADIVREVGTNYYEGGGSEGLIRKIYRGQYDCTILEHYIREIIYQHLYYIPQGQVIHSELFDYEFNHCIHPFFQLMDHSAEISLIDTACSNILSSKTILAEADLIVVNLCQDPAILDDFFLNYSSLLPKAMILISQYSSHSIYSIKKISRKYPVSPERIYPIPYNEIFNNAIHYGSVIDFIFGNYHCMKESPNNFFIQAVKRAAYEMIKETERLQRRKSEELSQCGK